MNKNFLLPTKYIFVSSALLMSACSSYPLDMTEAEWESLNASQQRLALESDRALKEKKEIRRIADAEASQTRNDLITLRDEVNEHRRILRDGAY